MSGVERRDARGVQFQRQQGRTAGECEGCLPMRRRRRSRCAASQRRAGLRSTAAASVSRRQRLAMVAGRRWLGLAIMISTVFAVGSSRSSRTRWRRWH